MGPKQEPSSQIHSGTFFRIFYNIKTANLYSELGTRHGSWHLIHLCQTTTSCGEVVFFRPIYCVFQTYLLSFNSHTIPLIHLKYTVQWLLVYLHICATITTINFRTIYHTQMKPHTHQQSLPSLSPSSPWKLLIHFRSVDFPILDIPYNWNHIISGFLCLASFTQDNLSGVIHDVARISNPWLLWPDNIPLRGYTSICFSIHLFEGRLDCFQFGAIVNTVATYTPVSFSVTICFHFSWVQTQG